MGNKVAELVRWEYDNLSEIQHVAQKLLKFGGDFRIWLFMGDLGAGKTTIIKALCKELKVEDVVNSPTFSLVNEYETAHADIIYHFDFYRVKDEYEAYDIGVEEYFYSGNYCFIEWPSKISNLIPEKYLLIKINVINEDKRQLVISKHEEA